MVKLQKLLKEIIFGAKSRKKAHKEELAPDRSVAQEKSRVGNVAWLVKPRTGHEETCLSKGWVGDDPDWFGNKLFQGGFGVF